MLGWRSARTLSKNLVEYDLVGGVCCMTTILGGSVAGTASPFSGSANIWRNRSNGEEAVRVSSCVVVSSSSCSSSSSSN